ncbi:MAG: lysophospholipid acyltransferase family protein [Bdellovibrionales bacterium]
MKRLRQAAKVSAIFSMMAAFSVESKALAWRRRSRHSLWQERARLVSKYSKRALKVLGVRVDGFGAGPSSHNALYVGNHLSYLDVLVMAAQKPTCFVTSEEVRHMPGLGALCELGACLFVERRSRARLAAEVHEISAALRAGLNVTVFPESTSTNGEAVLRFRRPLFQAALDAGKAVAPFCLNYRRLDGQAVTAHNRDVVCWYGDMGFVTHLWKLASCDRIEVDVSWLERQHEHLQDSSAKITTEVLAHRAHAAVTQAYRPLGRAAQPQSPESSLETYLPMMDSTI